MQIGDFSVFPMLWGRKPASPSALIDLARHAEELGFYSFTIPHVPILPYAPERPPDGFVWKEIPPEFKDYQYDALVLLPMIAQATSRIRVGFNVLVTPWAHPFLWAKYIASLDAAAGGRIIAGFGLGHGPTGGPIKALDNIGIDGTQRGKMSDEALEFIVRLWQAEDVISFEGKFYRGVNLAIAPKPIQKPYPEIWWAGRAKPSIRRAAQYNGMLEVTWPPLGKVREEYAPGLARANRKHGSRSKLGICMYAGLFGKRLDRDELSMHYFNWTGEALEPIAAGDPEQCADVLRAYREAGIEHFVLDFHRHGLDSVRVLHEQMERFVRDVLPLLE